MKPGGSFPQVGKKLREWGAVIYNYNFPNQ
ncbi:Uncharacterised protein [Pseudomonas putida]|uniref:Uncharacterized protein n=1 Tax=Pseudomonas putida TaxID=303 RepID=A0A6S5T7S8_PSEPU|nr:Uncharacterised protein [Pseudomonas putida]SDD64181.1 hypothetical protein SAMN05216185_11036 [Pseudomonas guariconensis]CAB5568531.1 Uncharacterised protein [Pseudomonas putida]CAB5590690.1 Uncharacterised protein [Pseudomonas putida]CAB5615763.1 Uncharacterised protein [Pseudomonas putida]